MRFLLPLICATLALCAYQPPIRTLFNKTPFIVLTDSIQHEILFFTDSLIGDDQSRQSYIAIVNKRDKILRIKRRFLSDPLYLCSFPEKEIRPNDTFVFKICWYLAGREGTNLYRTIELDFEDKGRLVIDLRGYVK